MRQLVHRLEDFNSVQTTEVHGTSHFFIFFYSSLQKLFIKSCLQKI